MSRPGTGSGPLPWLSPEEAAALAEGLERLRADMLASEDVWRAEIRAAHPDQHESARNMAHYLALRSADRRDLQSRLVRAGLAGLARAPGACLAGVERTLQILRRLDGHAPRRGSTRPEHLGFDEADDLLALHTRGLLLAPPERRRAEIMVTLPREAATDAGLVARMIAAGMDCARVNCAHDGPDEWRAMIANVRRAAASGDHACRIFMDLGGPKVRTRGIGPEGLRLREGETVHLIRTPGASRSARRASDGSPAPCFAASVDAVADRIGLGQPVWFDDGRLGGVVTGLTRDGAEITITRAPPRGRVLRDGKGINLPGTDLGLQALTDADERALPFVAGHADMVGLSFIERPDDVLGLRERLDALGGADVATVLKIETQRAVDRLPRLLFAAMRAPLVGVMLARGDLAVECGWDRLAEVQGLVLAMSAAAHAPLIRATQVLDGLARKGVPSRPEVTDAAVAERAECVMLNKGPHVVSAIGLLDQILERVQAHQRKEDALLPAIPPWRHAARDAGVTAGGLAGGPRSAPGRPRG